MVKGKQNATAIPTVGSRYHESLQSYLCLIRQGMPGTQLGGDERHDANREAGNGLDRGPAGRAFADAVQRARGPDTLRTVDSDERAPHQ